MENPRVHCGKNGMVKQHESSSGELLIKEIQMAHISNVQIEPNIVHKRRTSYV